jgi:hypothetical protein
MEEMSEKELIYRMMEAKYMVDNNYKSLMMTFSMNWIKSENLDLKMDILAKAIRENKKIYEIFEYEENFVDNCLDIEKEDNVEEL